MMQPPQLEDPRRASTRRRARKLLAALGLVGGVMLVVLEVTRTFTREEGETGIGWFWIVVALLLIALALAELLDRQR